MRHVIRNIGVLGITLLLLTAPLKAQEQRGRIAGIVRDAETNEPLIGANILVVGTSLGAATDLNGRFEITGIRPGEYTLRVTYIGYQTQLITGIKVGAGETTEVEIRLKPEVIMAEQEVVVVGERPLVDVEQSSSTFAVTRQQLEVAPVREVKAVIATQAGVIQDPTGLYIRGGRAYETGFVVDGVSAKDPLAGTGFGLDLGTNAIREIEVTTGGVSAEYGDVTSGVVVVRTREGGDTFSGSFMHKRDNFGGLNRNWKENYNEDVWEFTLGGPIIPGKLRFFTSAQVNISDEFTRTFATPDYVRSSLIKERFFMPRTSNRWNGLIKLTYLISPEMKLQGSYQRSLTINQNTRMLQVTGNEAIIRPGFQYEFSLQLDKANTFAHDNNIAYLKWTHAISDLAYYELQVSRLFTRLRADANGRRWRPFQVDTELDPESIVVYPVTLFTAPDGTLPDSNVVFVLPGPGLYNNGGIATRWHDHFAEEWTLKGTFTQFSQTKAGRITVGFESNFNDYQWIDIIRPWIGAPIITAAGDTTRTNRLGQSADIWRVRPAKGAFFTTNQIRYRGLIANLGLRLEYWFPGKYVDDLIDNPDAPILESVREAYKKETYRLFGRRFKLRLLPKIRVSFPIRENQVLFFNYGRSARLPHPTFIYAGLDPFYQSRSFFANLGNPNLNPEVDISYELGLRYQITSNDVLTVTAFWRDKFDFITVEDIVIKDLTGRETVRAFRVNGDFARIRGLEASYYKRIGDWFEGRISGSFSRATGLSSTNNDALVQFLARGDIENTFEIPLAWDRPVDIKASTTFSYNRKRPLLGIPGLNRLKLYLATTFRSGQRYTPVEYQGRQRNPFTGELDWRPIYVTVSDPAKRYAHVGTPWWWFDMNLQRLIRVGKTDLRLTLEITNLFNQLNSVIVNPVTGKAYPNVDPETTDFTRLRDNPEYDVPIEWRDPRYVDPTTTGVPPFNPARFLPQRHIVLGIAYEF